MMSIIIIVVLLLPRGRSHTTMKEKSQTQRLNYPRSWWVSPPARFNNFNNHHHPFIVSRKGGSIIKR